MRIWSLLFCQTITDKSKKRIFAPREEKSAVGSLNANRPDWKQQMGDNVANGKKKKKGTLWSDVSTPTCGDAQTRNTALDVNFWRVRPPGLFASYYWLTFSAWIHSDVVDALRRVPTSPGGRHVITQGGNSRHVRTFKCHKTDFFFSYALIDTHYGRGKLVDMNFNCVWTPTCKDT